MKVVLFCGGLGTRLREHSDTIPKPLVPIGNRPIIWYLMKYYAHYGHKDFILCLGYKGDMIREYFLNYNPYLSTNFVMSKAGAELIPAGSDIEDWRITFVDTGLHSNIGERLVAIRSLLDEDEMFLANYSDQLSDLDLTAYLNEFIESDHVAGFVATHPSQSFHAVTLTDNGIVTDMRSVSETDFCINGGYLVLRREIFDYIDKGQELVEQPFQKLIAEKRLFAYKYAGFWAAMDTFKDKISFDRMHGNGETPWEVWKR